MENKIITELGIDYVTYKPYPHQVHAAFKAYQNKKFAFLFEVGAGKTFSSILTLRMLCRDEKRLLKTLIISPLVTLGNWKNEILIHSKIKEKDVVVCDMNGVKRINLIKKELTNYEGLVIEERILIINWEALLNKEISEIINEWGPEVIIGDEIHKIKSHTGKVAKAALKLADKTRSINGTILGLTGTMILNKVTDLFMPYQFIDGGQTFGKNFFVFRNTYMFDKNANWSGRPNHFPDWQPRPELFSELTKKMYRLAHRVTKEEALPFLPPLVKTSRTVELSSEQRKLYKEMHRDFITFISTKSDQPKAVVANIALTKALRLMQIISGFVMDEDGNTHYVKENPRLKITKELLEEITPNHKVILWCNFKADYKQLAKLCDEIGVKYTFLTGEQSGKEKSEAIKAFQEDKEVRVKIGNRAAGIGVNLTAASYTLVYGRDFSLGNEIQSEARNYRAGSEVHEKIIKIDLIAKDTIDEQVIEALNNKQKISDVIVDWGKR